MVRLRGNLRFAEFFFACTFPFLVAQVRIRTALQKKKLHSDVDNIHWIIANNSGFWILDLDMQCCKNLSSWGGSSPAVWTSCLCFSLFIFCLQLGRWKVAGKSRQNLMSHHSSVLTNLEFTWGQVAGQSSRGQSKAEGQQRPDIFFPRFWWLYHIILKSSIEYKILSTPCTILAIHTQLHYGGKIIW